MPLDTLGGRAGIELPWSDQYWGRTTRRAVAKANGRTIENQVLPKAELAGVWEMPRVSILYSMASADVEVMGIRTRRISRRKLKAAILDSRAAKARKVW